MKTEEQLKSFRIELQKTQEQQERRRIQQETAKVFLGTVIQRGGVGGGGSVDAAVAGETEERSHSSTSRKFRFFSAHWCRHTSNSWLANARQRQQDSSTAEIDERPETAEQFCQKLSERQNPPVIILPSGPCIFLHRLKKLCCSWCCCVGV